MHKQHKYPDHPHVHSVGEEYQKCRQRVMQNILIVAPLRTDEDVHEKASQVFAHFYQVEDPHGFGRVLQVAILHECEH